MALSLDSLVIMNGLHLTIMKKRYLFAIKKALKNTLSSQKTLYMKGKITMVQGLNLIRRKLKNLKILATDL